MLKYNFLLSLILLLFIKLSAQPDLQWDLILSGNPTNYFSAITHTQDEGCVIVTSTTSDEDFEGAKGNVDTYVAKYDGEGDLVWDYVLGGSERDQISEISPTSDGGFILVGHSNSIDGDLEGISDQTTMKAFMVKMTATGEVEWVEVFVEETIFRTVKIDDQDNIYTTSSSGFSTMGEVTVSKFSSDGTKLWSDLIFIGDAVYYSDLAVDQEGNVYRVNGIQVDSDYSDIMITKFDSGGDEIWSKIYEGNGFARGHVIEIVDDELWLAGNTTSTNGVLSGEHGSFDSFVASFDLDGNIISKTVLGGSSYDEISDMKIFGDKILVTGSSQSIDNDFNVPFPDSDGDVFIAELDLEGVVNWVTYSGGEKQESKSRITILNGSTFMLAYGGTSQEGTLDGSVEGWKTYLASYDLQGALSAENPVEFDVAIYPNPSTQKISLELDDVRLYSLKIYGTNGALLMHKKLLKEKEIDISNLPSGLMHIALYKDGRKVSSQSVLKE